MAMEKEGQRDLVVNDGEFAYVQDGTKGLIQTIVGPQLFTPAQSDVPVRFDPESKLFRPCGIYEAKQPYCVADERSYIVLHNPADPEDKQLDHPSSGVAKFAKSLHHGSKIVIPGPVRFALWPRQLAEIIPGHDLKSNQYLLARVYNAEEATKSWTMWPKTEPAKDKDGNVLPNEQQPKPQLYVGQLLVIKGTDVSFFIPPTGIEVLKENGSNYVREALTLEALEYCILRDENGSKRYEIGPAVVFPEPTETFVEVPDEKGNKHKKARAIELNELQGIHLKVIADYTEVVIKDYVEVIPDGKGTKVNRKTGEKIERKAGEELFVTGAQTTIFYPSEELAFVKYDGKTKSFATTVPEGEARYVLNRLAGEIETVKGPLMLLPDPRTHVIVRRVLSDNQVTLWYPGNGEALIYNRSLQSIMNVAPTTRSGTLSEGDIARNMKGAKRSQNLLSDQTAVMAMAAVPEALYTASGSAVGMTGAGESSRVSRDQAGVGDEFTRQSGYTAPRTITLETKYQGAVAISVWTGYAILVVSKTGDRRVVRGPTTVLLDYDETLEVLTLSTGKPKTTDNPYKTVYLRVDNNKVSDVVDVISSDGVPMKLKLSYLVNFEGDVNKWFNVENYVKFMTDHARSVLKGKAQKIDVQTFFKNSTDLTRDFILGTDEGQGRSGMVFKENGMAIRDVEVLHVEISVPAIQSMLLESQQKVVTTNIDLANYQRQVSSAIEKAQLEMKLSETQATNKKLKVELEKGVQAAETALKLDQIANALKEVLETRKKELEFQANLDIIHDADLARSRKTHEQEIALGTAAQQLEINKLKSETEAAVERFKAAAGPFSQILTQLSDKALMEKLAQAMSLSSHIDDKDHIAELLKQAAGINSIADIVTRLSNVLPKNGANKTLPAAPSAA